MSLRAAHGFLLRNAEGACGLSSVISPLSSGLCQVIFDKKEALYGR